jgi:rubrerythrin
MSVANIPEKYSREYYQNKIDSGETLTQIAIEENSHKGTISKRFKKLGIIQHHANYRTPKKEKVIPVSKPTQKKRAVERPAENDIIVDQITEKMLEQYIFDLSKSQPNSSTVAKLMMDFLDKKKAITKMDLNRTDPDQLQEIEEVLLNN